MTTGLKSWNLPDFLVCLESKTEPSVAKEQNYMWGGHHTEKFVLEGGDTAHIFLMSGTNGVGTPHNIERKQILGGRDAAHTLLGWGHRTIFTEKA